MKEKSDEKHRSVFFFEQRSDKNGRFTRKEKKS